MTFDEIAQEIREGKNIDIHVKDSSKFVRRLVAQEGYQLEALVNDPSEEVRAAVAKRGYGLETLRHDRSDWVRLAALEKLAERQENRNRNANYDIVHRIEAGGYHFVVGHNPKAPAAYVTWEYVEARDYYYQGHYFVQEEDALVDLFKRAGESLKLGDRSIALALLTDDDRTKLREQREFDAICYALDDRLGCSDYEYDREALLKDPQFLHQATRILDNVDHSAENEAIADAMDELLEDFPQHRKLYLVSETAELKISPELNALVQDLMTIPTAQAAKKYGPLGDNIEFRFPCESSLQISIEIVPSYDRQDPNSLSDTDPHTAKITLLDAKGNELGTVPTVLFRPESDRLTGKYEIGLQDVVLTLSLQEDEALRRVGNRFVFRFDGDLSDETYAKHQGELCTVKRALTPEECDILQMGLMWVAEFSNGDLIHCFDYELELPREGERKPALSDLVQDASSRQAQQGKPLAGKPDLHR